MAWYEWLGLQKKESAAGTAISAIDVGRPVWTPRNYEQFAREAYVRNAIAFRCIEMTAQAAATIPHMLMKGDKRIDDHLLLDLLKNPAPQRTSQWLIASIMTYLQISGNSYTESVGPSSHDAPPRELWTHRPDRMKVIKGEGGMPAGFKYSAHGKSVTWDVDRITGASDIMHIKKFHPINDWYGLSAVEPASFAVDRHNEAGAHNMAVLQNGATPSGALMLKPVKVDGNDASAPQHVIDAAEKRLREQYTGTGNSGKPMVLGGNVDWVSFGMTMEELQLSETKLDAARDICIANGVPIELLLPGQSTFNNKREAKLAYYEETVLPALDNIHDHLNIWLAPRFGEDLKLKADLDEVSALSLRREIRQTATTKLYNDGIIDRDEAREALQFEAQPELPQRKIDASVLSALLKAAQDDPLMTMPLYRYLLSVGLVEKGQSFDDFVAAAVDFLASLEEEDEEEEEDDSGQTS